MKTILHISTIREDSYEKYTYKSKLIDRFKIKKYSDISVSEMNTDIKMVSIPANFNKEAYKLNLNRVINKKSNKYDYLSVNGNRMYDLYLMNKFQLSIFSYSIVESLRIILMKSNKSIKVSNILVDIDERPLLLSVLNELAKESKNIIILANNLKKSEKIREIIMSNYGVAIEIVYNYTDVEIIDFVISSKNKEYKCTNVWYINNLFKPKGNGIYISDVLYRIPWDIELKDMPPQLIGLIINSKRCENIFELLQSNDIRIQSILYDGKETNLH